MRANSLLLRVILTAFWILGNGFSLSFSGEQITENLIPVTSSSAPGYQVGQKSPANAKVPAFDTFVQSVKDSSRASQVVGVYVEGVLADRIAPQPIQDPAFVTSNTGELTQFLLAEQAAGNLGFLGHNTLDGAYFFSLQVGDIVSIIYGDGFVVEYEVTKLSHYQALTPDSPTSDFLDLQSGMRLSASDLFYQMYGGEHHLTFQTCISQDNNNQWGRLFVVAEPLSVE